MNRRPSDSELHAAVKNSVAALEVPSFNLAAVRARRTAGAIAVRPNGTVRRRLLIAVPVAVAVLALLFNIPSVIAQMERALHAFTVVDGRTVPLNVRSVTLAEARAEMPFTVIAPAGVPPRFRMTINALSSEAAPRQAQLVFEFRNPGSDAPVLTIAERSNAVRGRQELMLSERRVIGGPARGAGRDGPPLPDGSAPLEQAPPGAAPQPGAVVHNMIVRKVNGRTIRRDVTLHPLVWVVRGTRILLASPEDGLTQAELDAIRSAMSR